MRSQREEGLVRLLCSVLRDGRDNSTFYQPSVERQGSYGINKGKGKKDCEYSLKVPQLVTP